MTHEELKTLLAPYKAHYSPAPSRRLQEVIFAIPDEVTQQPVRLGQYLKRASAWRYLAPRLAGLAMACSLGIYFGISRDGLPLDDGLDQTYNQYLILEDDILQQDGGQS